MDCHPDLAGPDERASAEAEFKALGAAYSQLLGGAPMEPGAQPAWRSTARPAGAGWEARHRTRSSQAKVKPMPMKVLALLCLPFGLLAYEATVGTLGALRQEGGWLCPRCLCTNEPAAVRCCWCRSPHVGLQYAHLKEGQEAASRSSGPDLQQR
uniref:RanBP2-type domain-containing protein n=1 Tax=Alexandrium andersonii TaxID=327968 RepID=A0A7S2N238_9DINO